MKKLLLFLLIVGILLTTFACNNGGTGDNVGKTSENQTTVKKYNPDVVKIQLCGDILLHESVTKPASLGGNKYNFKPSFEFIKKYFDGDMIIANMEAPVDADGDNKNIAAYPLFNFPIEILDAVKYAGFNTLITANNHAFDKHWNGLKATIDNIEAKGMDAVGTYRNAEEFNTPFIKEYNGIKIGITAWSDSDNGNGVGAENRPHAMKMFDSKSTEDVPKILSEVEKLKAAGAAVVIVSLHWGAEYVSKPINDYYKQTDIADMLIDGGADIIMGNHAHAVQPIVKREAEQNGKKRTGIIIYSLGNFFVDQSALDDPVQAINTADGMIVSLSFKRNTDTGEVAFSEGNYMPTITYKHGSPKKHIIYPLGLSSKAINTKDSEHFKKAFNRVTGVVGDDLPYINGE